MNATRQSQGFSDGPTDMAHRKPVSVQLASRYLTSQHDVLCVRTQANETIYDQYELLHTRHIYIGV